MQPAGRIDERHINRARFRRRNAVERDCRRIGPVTLTNNIRSNAIRPDLQLVDRRCAKCIAGDQQRLPPALRQPLRHLGNGRCFTDSVHPDGQDNERFGALVDQLFKRRTGNRPQHVIQCAAQHILEPAGRCRVGATRLFSNLPHQTVDDVSPQVGTEQRRFKFFKQGRIRSMSKKPIE